MWLLLACGRGFSPPLPPSTDTTDLEPTDTGSPPTTESTTEPTLPEAPSSCDQPAADGTSLCLSEVQADNRSTWSDAPGSFPDWLELENRGTRAILPSELSFVIGDEEVAVAGEVPILPGEVRLLVADGDELPDHLATSIRAGEEIRVYVGVDLADAWEVSEIAPDLSLHRGDWGVEPTCVPTPGLPNAPTVPCSDPRELVYALGTTWDFHLAIDDLNWRLLSSSDLFYYPPGEATLTYPTFGGGTATLPQVGITLKGGYGSFRNDLASQKVGLKLDLNRFDDYEWRGAERVTLNNAVQDPSLVHEYLTYTLFRAVGIPAPRVGYANVWLNGQYLGYYVMVEAVDDVFLEDWYGDGSGHLLESAYGPDFDLGDEPYFEYDEGPDEVAGRALITEVATLLAVSPWDEATYAQLRTLVDMDEWMLNMAVEAAVWHWDGYWTENNYYAYESPTTGLLTIIPHGTDQTWTGGWPNAWDGNGQSVLYQFCLTVPSCAATYETQVRLVADTIDTLGLEAQLDAVVAATQLGYDGDGRGEGRDQRQPQIDATRYRIQTVSGELRAYADAH